MHILCQCQLKEEPQSRITWRHDSVLFAIFRAILAVVNRFKDGQQSCKRSGAATTSSRVMPFVSETGTKYAVRAPMTTELLAKATDWNLQFDLTAPAYGQTKERPFPPEIVANPGKRPDGVIWSCSSRIVLWVELTSPWEPNMEERHFFKLDWYTQLKIACEGNGWKVYPLCVEIGCQGRCSRSFYHMCGVLGFTNKERDELKYDVERTALHCSHAILCARYQKQWLPKPLLDVSKWH